MLVLTAKCWHLMLFSTASPANLACVGSDSQVLEEVQRVGKGGNASLKIKLGTIGGGGGGGGGGSIIGPKK